MYLRNILYCIYTATLSYLLRNYGNSARRDEEYRYVPSIQAFFTIRLRSRVIPIGIWNSCFTKYVNMRTICFICAHNMLYSGLKDPYSLRFWTFVDFFFTFTTKKRKIFVWYITSKFLKTKPLNEYFYVIFLFVPSILGPVDLNKKLSDFGCESR